MEPNPQELSIWSHLLKKSLIENFIFSAVAVFQFLLKSLFDSQNDFPLALLNTFITGDNQYKSEHF